QAVKDGKLVAVTFVDPKKVKKHGELEEALAAEELAALKERFVWVEQPLKVDDKRSPIARKLGVSSAPALVFLDPRGEGELDKKRVLGKVSSPKSVKAALEEATSKADAREDG
ncbi:MAG: hypothetical protein KDD82_20370, partial [Planctomycetes bacterium]|nr:hypothetical protein [Planctomycetota bacterium]